MNSPREPLRKLDYIAMAALAVYALAAAVGVVWMLIQIARLIHATGHGETICGVAIVLILMATITTATNKRR